jgi:hypothetical protein
MSWIGKFISIITQPIRLLFNWLGRVVPFLRNLPALSVPTRAAVATFLFLLAIVVIAAIRYALADPEEIDEIHWIRWAVAGLLTFLTPIFVYQAVRFWLLEPESPFPRIDEIWEAAQDKMDQNEIDIGYVPLYLVLGAKDLNEAGTLIRASELEMNVHEPPHFKGDLAVYANADAIFLFLPGCSCISQLAAPPGSHATVEKKAANRSSEDVTGTIQPFATDHEADDGIEGTLINEDVFSEPPQSGLDSEATINLGEMAGDDVEHPLFGAGEESTRRLTSEEREECLAKLGYVCKLISQARGSICPINGLMTLLPFELVERSSGELKSAIQFDLALLREELKVRCQNVVLVTHMHKMEGFRELVERLGPAQVHKRFGKGGTLWSLPEKQRLNALAIHAVGAFEDWIYSLFRQDSLRGFQHNSKLFMLLARTRRTQFIQKLADVIAGSFSSDFKDDPELAREQFLFGGCYFAATGAAKDAHAFVRGVFDKLIRDQGELEWTPRALQRDRQYQLLANCFALLGTISLLAIAYMVFLHFYPQESTL